MVFVLNFSAPCGNPGQPTNGRQVNASPQQVTKAFVTTLWLCECIDYDRGGGGRISDLYGEKYESMENKSAHSTAQHHPIDHD